MSMPILPTIISKMSIILDIEFKSAVMPTVAKAEIVSNNTFVVSSFGFWIKILNVEIKIKELDKKLLVFSGLTPISRNYIKTLSLNSY